MTDWPAEYDTWHPPTGGVKAFLEETAVPPEYFSKARARLDHYTGNMVELRTLAAMRPGQGHGRRLLEWLLLKADEHDVDLYVIVAARSCGLMSQDQLRDWYGKFGFEVTPRGQDYLWRKAPAPGPMP